MSFTPGSIVRLRADHTAFPRLVKRFYDAGDEFVVFKDDGDTLILHDPMGMAVSIPRGLLDPVRGPDDDGDGTSVVLPLPRRRVRRLVAA